MLQGFGCLRIQVVCKLGLEHCETIRFPSSSNSDTKHVRNRSLKNSWGTRENALQKSFFFAALFSFIGQWIWKRKCMVVIYCFRLHWFPKSSPLALRFPLQQVRTFSHQPNTVPENSGGWPRLHKTRVRKDECNLIK